VAINCLNKAIKLDPEYAKAWQKKGAILNDRGRYKEAVKCFDKVISLKSRSAEAWNNKGIALEALGRESEAEKAFARAREMGGSDPT